MPNIMVGFNQRVNLVACYLIILSILRRNKLEMFHEDTASRQELDRRLSPFEILPIHGTNIFVFFFLLQWCPEARRFLPDYWNKSDDLWESVRLFRNLHDRPDRQDRTHFYPSD